MKNFDQIDIAMLMAEMGMYSLTESDEENEQEGRTSVLEVKLFCRQSR